MLVLAFFIIGTFVGSFLNVVVLRLKNGAPIVFGRSACPNCRQVLGIFDLVPVLSFLFLGGKCRYCRKPISWEYIIMELVTGALFAATYFFNSQNIGVLLPDISSGIWQSIALARNLFFVSVLLVLFVYDLKYLLILDKITLPAILIAILANSVILGTWGGLIIATILGALFFFLQFVFSSGRWVGGGDIRMGALMGAMLGWPYFIVALFLAYILGAIWGVGAIILEHKSWGSKIPFGTFLSLATLIVLFFGKILVQAYWGLLIF